MRVGARLPSAVGTTSEETISHEMYESEMIPPRGQVHISRGKRKLILNTERFHKRATVKREQERTPDSKGVERDTLSIIGCRMKCPNSGVGTQEVSMNLSVTWAHRTLGDLSSGRTKRSVMNALRPVGRYCAHLNEMI